MRRLIPLVAAVALGACGGTSSPATTLGPDTTVVPNDSVTAEQAPENAVTIDVTVGEDSGKDRVETVALGAEVTINITNPEDGDEFHLHGYDMSSGEVGSGETATISFTADKAGEFEVESHVTEELIMTIVVK